MIIESKQQMIDLMIALEEQKVNKIKGFLFWALKMSSMYCMHHLNLDIFKLVCRNSTEIKSHK